MPNLASIRKSLRLAADPTAEKVEELIQVEVDRLNEKLPPWERIKKFALLDVEFSIQSGELTPSLKLKRRVIHEKFGDHIERLYESEA